jgi:hypothetical protein
MYLEINYQGDRILQVTHLSVDILLVNIVKIRHRSKAYRDDYFC